MREKKVCESCFSQATTDREAEDLRTVLLVKQAVRESMQAKPRRSPPRGRHADEQAGPSRSASTQSGRSQSDSDRSDAEDSEPELFDFAQIRPFIRSIRRTLQWEEPAPEPEKRKFFKRVRKENLNFPFIGEIKELFDEEWGKVEKKSLPHNRFAKMYPFDPEDVRRLDNAPTVDAALTKMARHVTLPLDDTVSFRDSLDRRAEVDLKRIYVTAGAASKPAVALTSVSKAMEKWAASLEEAAGGEEATEDIWSVLKDMKLSAAFIAEASVDIVKLLARIMLWATTARRAMWLRPWLADPISKQSWCRIPFEGQSLFGDKLEAAIAKATGGKSSFLPQDRRLARQRRLIPSAPPQNRLRDARAYRPGKEPRRPWSNPQTTQASAPKKPFLGRGGRKSF